MAAWQSRGPRWHSGFARVCEIGCARPPVVQTIVTYTTIGFGDFSPDPHPGWFATIFIAATFFGLGITATLVRAASDPAFDLSATLRGLAPRHWHASVALRKQVAARATTLLAPLVRRAAPARDAAAQVASPRRGYAIEGRATSPTGIDQRRAASVGTAFAASADAASADAACRRSPLAEVKQSEGSHGGASAGVAAGRRPAPAGSTAHAHHAIREERTPPLIEEGEEGEGACQGSCGGYGGRGTHGSASPAQRVVEASHV